MMTTSALPKARTLILGVLLLAGCRTPDEVVGDYVPLMAEPGVSESLRMARSHQFHYRYEQGTNTFVHTGTWELETRQGHDYVVMRLWQVPRSRRCGLSRSTIASFDLEGEELWLIKDLPDCAWRKLPPK